MDSSTDYRSLKRISIRMVPTVTCRHAADSTHRKLHTNCTPAKAEAFSRKLMKKAFMHFGFKGALSEVELTCNADSAANELTGRITEALVDNKACNADELADSVIEQHTLAFSDKGQRDAVKYVAKELGKFFDKSSQQPIHR